MQEACSVLMGKWVPVGSDSEADHSNPSRGCSPCRGRSISMVLTTTHFNTHHLDT